MKKKQKEITKPICSMRLNVTSIDVFADDMMEALTRNAPDLSDAKVAVSVKAWLRGQLANLAQHLQYDFAKGAELGMKEMSQLLVNPEYGKLVRSRRDRLTKDAQVSPLVRQVRKIRSKKSR